MHQVFNILLADGQLLIYVANAVSPSIMLLGDQKYFLHNSKHTPQISSLKVVSIGDFPAIYTTVELKRH